MKNHKRLYWKLLVAALLIAIVIVKIKSVPDAEKVNGVAEEVVVEEVAVEETIVEEVVVEEEALAISIEEPEEEVVEEEVLEEEIIEDLEEVPEEELVEEEQVLEDTMIPEDLLDSVLGVWDPMLNQFQTDNITVSAIYKSEGEYCYLVGSLQGEQYSGTLNLDAVEIVEENIYQIGVVGLDGIQMVYLNTGKAAQGMLYVGMSADSWIPCTFVHGDYDEGMRLMEEKYLR